MAMTAKEKAAVAAARKGGLTVMTDGDILKRVKEASKAQGISLYAAAKLVAHRAGKKLSRADKSAAKQAAQRSRKSKGMKLSDLTTPSKGTLEKATRKVAAKQATEMESRGGKPQTLKRAISGAKQEKSRAAAAKERTKKLERTVKSFRYDKPTRQYKKLYGKTPTTAQLEQFVRRVGPITDKKVAKYDKLVSDYKKQFGKTPTVAQLEELDKYAGTSKKLGSTTNPAYVKKLVDQYGSSGRKPGAHQPTPTPTKAKKKAKAAVAKAAPAKAATTKAATTKAASLKGAPRPELPKKSDPDYKTKLAKFRKWYTANRAKPKKKKVVLTKAAPVKTAPTKTAPKKAADPTGLKARIAQKRETGQRIPKSWLKAEREKDLKVTKENLAEVQRGRKEMAERKSRIAAANMKVTKENLAEVQRGRKEMSERKARVSADKARRKAQRLAQLDPLVKARQKAEVARGKTEAQERVARMRKDAAERAKRKRMQATMSALPGFRSK